jgi:predicted O-linked N-acetylglucosamine transferase (SPINDLY family)
MYAPASALAGLRLAPVQCAAWGHPVTSGLPTIDYFLSSELMEPENADEHYTEQLIRLPNLSVDYERVTLPANPKSRESFGIGQDAFVYLSSQSLFKYLPHYDGIFPAIASRVPNARFVFISNPSKYVTRDFKDRLATAFDSKGLRFETFCLVQPRLNPDDFLSLNLMSNVLLDTISWSGGQTTLEAISCGLPVVTSPTQFMRGRHAFAMLRLMELEETIASNQNEYTAIAVKLAREHAFYAQVKEKILNNRHRIFEDLSATRALETFFEDAVSLR